MKFLSKILKPKNSVSVLLWVRDVAIYMKDKFKDVDLYEHRYKSSFILHVARVIEADYRGEGDKKKACIDVLKALIPKFNETDIAVIEGIYDDLEKSGQIRGPSSLKVLKKLALQYFHK
ncbi:MAG: hypothetical protein EOP48_22500 [Sphingobacteriales bacterium]|nr:MAG: hypothetical protein EOP48_22500 [Sphingobacteriales bacterium]